ncbi:MAG TPA: PilN domain-containing protein [Candidatus Angelobacter sp.]|nr:PilN domain-containing protein [Candidatus Angelobacter sp.]
MIRINLLGIPKAKRGKRPAAPASLSDGPSTTLLVLIFVIVLAAGLWGWYTIVDRQRVQLHKDLQAAQAENQRLAEVKAKYEANRRKAEQFEQRFRIIDQLKQAQSGPVSLLNMVADTVSKTDAVWLEAITDDGKNIDFTGLALSPDAVANLMANLEKTGKFKTVEIKETSQASEIKELQAFKFELICEKSGPNLPGAPGAPGAPVTPAAAKLEKKS